MFKVKWYVWTILDIIGMVLLAAGVLGVIDMLPIEMGTSVFMMAAGIVLIVFSAVFIQLEGMRLRKEHNEYQRFSEVRDEARTVPNDLDEGYQIDYTAKPGSAISYDSNRPAKETMAEKSEEDFYVESPVLDDAPFEDDPESDVVIVYSKTEL